MEREELADWLGAMDEARNVYDITDEATTVLNIDVEVMADRLVSLLTQARAESAREALEAAARDWQDGEGFTLMARPSRPPAVPAIDYAQRTLDWLRARAASAADQGDLGEEGRCPSRCGRNDPCPDPWHDRPTPTVPVSRESEENHDG